MHQFTTRQWDESIGLTKYILVGKKATGMKVVGRAGSLING